MLGLKKKKPNSTFSRQGPLFVKDIKVLSDDEAFIELTTTFEENGKPPRTEPIPLFQRLYSDIEHLFSGNILFIVFDTEQRTQIQSAIAYARGKNPKLTIHFVEKHTLSHLQTDIDEAKKGNFKDRKLKTEVQDKIANLVQQLNSLDSSDLHIRIISAFCG